MSKNMNVPKLRFSEFGGEWEEKKLGDITEVSSGGTPSRTNQNYWNGKIPWVTTTLIDFKIIDKAEELITEDGLKNSSAKIFPIGTILMAMYGQGKTRGKVGILGIEASTNQACGAIIVNKDKLNSLFLFHNLAKRYDEIRNLSNQGGQENLSGGIIKSIYIPYTTLKEQEKIASVLTSVDTKIEQLTKKEALLQEYKKGVMSKIFNQEIRFKDEDGSKFPEWEDTELGNILIENKEKTTINNQYDVLSSTKDDIVLQSEYFNREIASKDNIGYKVLKKNQLVFSPQNLWLGNININTKYEVGMVSPSYKIYNIEEKIILINYLKYIIKTPEMMFNYEQASEQGASVVRRSLNIDLFNIINISIPSLEEQTKIANFLSSIDKKIDLTTKELNSTKEFKKALLQQMFV